MKRSMSLKSSQKKDEIHSSNNFIPSNNMSLPKLIKKKTKNLSINNK
jgi:hypothetical protein